MSLGVQIWLYAMTIDKYPGYQSVLVCTYLPSCGSAEQAINRRCSLKIYLSATHVL